MKRKLLSFGITFFVGLFLGSLFQSIKQTIYWSDDFYGLVILTTLSEKSVSKNPYSKDFYWIGPETAFWILKNCEYPYKSCNKKSDIGCGEPKISWVGRGIGLHDLKTENRLYELMKHLVKRGEPLDAYTDFGFTALHEAVLGNQTKYAKFLIDNGANPYLKVKRKGSSFGMNAFEFADLLEQKDPDRYKEIASMLKDIKPNKAFSR